MRYKDGVEEPCVEEVGNVFRGDCGNWPTGIVEGRNDNQRCEDQVVWAGTFEGVLWGFQVAGQAFNGAGRCLRLNSLSVTAL